jgi:hypothetical protein
MVAHHFDIRSPEIQDRGANSTLTPATLLTALAMIATKQATVTKVK